MVKSATKIRTEISKLSKGKSTGELTIHTLESKGICTIKNKKNEGIIHITKNVYDIAEVVIKGQEIEFKDLPVTSDIGWKMWDLSGTGIKFPALKITGLNQPTNDDLMIELISNLGRLIEGKNQIDSDGICKIILKTLAEGFARGDLMSDNARKGLYGELIFLEKLVVYSKKHNPTKSLASVLGRWTGPDTNLRDFATKGLFVEVKTTGNKDRLHTINKHIQLISQGGEGQGYLFSVSAGPDNSAGEHFVDLINRLRGHFKKDGCEPTFLKALNNYGGKDKGYDVIHEPAYRRDAKFVKKFDSEIFEITLDSHEIIDNSSWGSIPKTKPIEYRKKPKYVRNISYELDLNSATFLTKSEVDDLLKQFV
jgi:hypothetical protein